MDFNSRWVYGAGAIKLASGTIRNLTVGRGMTLSVTGNGTLSNIAFKKDSIFNLDAGCSLELSGAVSLAGKVNLSSTITNSGTVTVSETTVFNLRQRGTTTLISGGTINGWNSLETSNFTYYGAAIDTMYGSSLDLSSEGVVTLSYFAAYLTWAGTSNNSTWDVKTTKNWKEWISAYSFHTGDNVTFGADAAEKTVTLENGANLAVGTMTVTGNSSYTFTMPASGNSATVSGASLTVDSGSTLVVGQGGGGTKHDINLRFDEIKLGGTLEVKTAKEDSWSKLTFTNENATLVLTELARETVGSFGNPYLSIGTVQMDAVGKITQAYSGPVSVGALTGSGDLTISSSTFTRWGVFTFGDLTGYSGTLTLDGSTLPTSGDYTYPLSASIAAANIGTTAKINVGADTTLSISGSGTIALGMISGAGTLSHTEGGELTLDGSATLGTLNQTAGTLNINGSATLGTLKQTAGTTLNINGSATLGTLNQIAGTLNINGSATLGKLNIFPGGTVKLRGTLSGTPTISFFGGGNLQFSKADGNDSATYSVGEIGTENNANSSAEITIDSGVTVNATSFNNAWGLNALTVNGELNVSDKFTFATDPGFANVVSGTGTISAGTFDFANIGSYTLTGVTLNVGTGGIVHKRESAHTLNLGNVSIVASAGDFTFASSSGETANLTDASTGTTFDTNGHVITVNQALSGAGKLKKVGTGTLTLSGANTYTGGTVIEAGTLVAANASALGAGNVTVADGTTLERGLASGSVAIGGTLTTEGSAILSIGALNADTAAFAVTGDVTLSAGTIFDVGELVAGGKVVSSAGTLTAADVTSGVVSGLGGANLYVGGYLLNQRGSATFSVSDNTLVLSAYTEGAKYSLTWNGGDAGVWKTNGSGWTTTDTTGEVTFQNGDSVTFGTGTTNTATLEGSLKVGALTVSAATTFSVADGSTALVTTGTLSLDANLTLNKGVTLKMTQTATGSNEVTDMFRNVAGTGTLSIILPGTNGLGVNAPDFSGTLYIQKPSGSESRLQLTSTTLGDGALIELADGADLVLNADMPRFSHDIKINGATELYFNVASSDSVEFSGDISGAGTLSFYDNLNLRTLVLSGKVALGSISLIFNKDLIFSGTATVGTLDISGDSVVEVTGAGVLTATLSGLDGTALILAGTGDKSTITLSEKELISGNLTIGNATVDASSGRGFAYNGGDPMKITLNEGGTLALGSNRLSFSNHVLFELNGGTITGTGDQYGAAMDFWGENTIKVTADSILEAWVCLPSWGGSGDLTFDVDEGKTLTFTGIINKEAETNDRKIIKFGAGKMILSGDNSNYSNGGFSIQAGTLVAASETALGKGGTISVSENATLGFVAGTTVDMLKTTTTNDVTTTTNGAIQLAIGAKIVVDMSGKDANQEEIVLNLVSGVALSYDGEAVTEDNVDTLLNPVISLKNWGDGWTQSLSYANDTLSLTLTIPEPSVFGLLAGLGALALAGTRRRRKKA